MTLNNPWQEFNEQAERKAFQSTVLTSLKGWAINWLEANAKKGDKGDKGEQGIQGPRGLQGDRGPKGDRGPRGYDGKDGKMGPMGPQGKPGKDGKNGRDGKDGKDGRDGKDGKRGQRGEKGEKGDRGPQGPPGPAGGGGGGGSINRFAFRGGAADPGTNDGFADDKWINYSTKEIFYRNETTDNWTSLGTLGSGGGGTPGGSDTQIQYNDSGSFAGSGTFTFNGSNSVTLDSGGLTNSTININGSTHHALISTATDQLKLRDTSAGVDRLVLTSSGVSGSVIVDEDNMASDSATLIPTQQSVKAYVDTGLAAKADTSHTHTASEITDFNTAADARITAQKGAANGVAPLGADSKIASTYLPAIALTDVSVVANEAAQLALADQEEGDVAIRTDENKSYVHNGGTAGDMTDWEELLTPTDAVLSVNGQTGTVSLDTDDISEATNLYYTEARVSANTDVAAATSHIANTSNPHSVTAAQVGLGNVENTALSTWAGSANVTTLGTIATGTWQGTAVGATYIGNLPASKTTSGTFDAARIPDLAASKITSGTFDAARIPDLSSSYAAVDANAAWQPPTLADATANNNSIYYSSDQSALVYKDGTGTVYRLHGGPAVYASSL